MKYAVLAIILAFGMTSHIRADELSKDQIEKIAEQYIDAILEKDVSAWKSLFLDIGDVSTEKFSWYFITSIKQIEIEDIDGHNVRLEIRRSSGKEDGWLQLLPDGKIKYGALVYKHPIAEAFPAQNALLDHYEGNLSYNLDVDSVEKTLLATGIPLFGYKRDRETHRDRRSPSHEKIKQLNLIKQWLLENGETWDRSEPKLSCPEEQFTALRKRYK